MKDTDKLDETLNNAKWGAITPSEAKQAILALYKEWAIELIDEDETVLGHATKESLTRDVFRAELRKKLGVQL